MTMRNIVRVVALLFMLVGWLLISFSSSDTAPRETWVTYEGTFVGVEFHDTHKLGRVATISIESDEPRFMLGHVERMPEFERAVGAFERGDQLAIDAVPRELADWAAPEGQPLYLLVLRHGGQVIYDQDRDHPGGAWIHTVVMVVGYLVSGVFLVVFLLTFRSRRPDGLK